MTADLYGKAVFLSGPITGMPDYNRLAFAKAASWCRRAGAEDVFNPAAFAPVTGRAKPHEWYMLRTLDELTSIAEDGGPYWDALVMLDGWRSSDGAMAEAAVARACGIPRLELGELS